MGRATEVSIATSTASQPCVLNAPASWRMLPNTTMARPTCSRDRPMANTSEVPRWPRWIDATRKPPATVPTMRSGELA